MSAIMLRKRNYLYTFLVVLLFLMPVSAGATNTGLTRFTLPNGLKVLVKQDHARKVATVQLWVNVGSANEDPSERGISHLIEHMAFKGTKKRGVGQMAADVEALGGRTNAYTSWDRTVFHVTIPSDATSQGLDILFDAVLHPLIDPKELKKEKEVVIEEILEGEDRPSQKSSKLLFKTAYSTHPYKFPVIGYRNIVEKLTRPDILAFRKKWYVPENMFLLIVGDVDPAKLRPEIERLTRGFAATKFVRPQVPVEPVQEKIRSALLRDANARETRLNIAFHIPSLESPDVNALDVAAGILGGEESSRLVRILKKEKQLVNSISAYSLTPKYPGLFVIGATLDAKNLQAATDAIMTEVRRLGKEPPTPGELKRAKTSIESSHVYAQETVGGVARNLGTFQADAGDVRYEDIYMRANADVTAPEVSRAVRRYLVPPNVTVTVLMPKKDDPGFRLSTLTHTIGSFTPVKSAEGKGSEPTKAVTRTLPNGMRVVLMPDDSNPVVSLRIASLGGKRFETRQTEGIMNFVARMATKGTKDLTEKQIDRKIEDLGGQLNGFSGYDSFGIDASFFSRYLKEGLKLVADIYRNPTFPAEKVERERKLILNRIKTEADRPTPFAVKTLNAAAFGNHPYGFDKEGTVKTVSAFTRDELLDTYRRFAVPSNTVITVVGDLDPTKTMALVKKLFGDIPGKKFTAPKVPRETLPQHVREKVVRMPRAKAYILIGFPGTTLKQKDRYALDVLNNLLAGQGGRLFRVLRDKESLAYVVTSFFRPGMDRGLFGFYIACDPAKADEALNGLLKQIRLVRQNPIGKKELTRSRKNLVGTHQISLQSSASRAENTVLNTLYGLGYNYDPEYLKRISEVTADQVHQAALKYLNPKRATIVKILPEEKKKQSDSQK
jgi:zinc protease